MNNTPPILVWKHPGTKKIPILDLFLHSLMIPEINHQKLSKTKMWKGSRSKLLSSATFPVPLTSSLQSQIFRRNSRNSVLSCCTLSARVEFTSSAFYFSLFLLSFLWFTTPNINFSSISNGMFQYQWRDKRRERKEKDSRNRARCWKICYFCYSLRLYLQ